MRAFSALVLLTLCVCTLASWFYLEPVRRTVSPIRATTSSDELLPESVLPLIQECTGTRPSTLSGLVEFLRSNREILGEMLEWRLVNFEDEDGKKFRLTFRPEKISNGTHAELRLYSMKDDGTLSPEPLDEEMSALPPNQAFQAALYEKIVLSDVSSTRYRMAGGQRLSLQTEQGKLRAVEYRAPGLNLHCSSTFGSTSCLCSRKNP